MTTGRKSSEKVVSHNGTHEEPVEGALTTQQMEQLRQIAQPLVMQYKLTQAAISGYLMGVGKQNVGYNLDINTGVVTLMPS